MTTDVLSNRSQGSHMGIVADIWGSTGAPSREDMAAGREGNIVSGDHRARVWGRAIEVGSVGMGMRGNMVWGIGEEDTKDSKALGTEV